MPLNKEKLLRPLISLSILISGLFFAYHLHYVWNFTVDDSFINFRHSRNLASGFGPNYNQSLPHIEGYVNFSWIVLMAIFYKLGFDMVTISKGVGLASTLIIAVAGVRWTHQLLGRTTNSLLLAFLFPAILFGFSASIIHSISGLETTFFSLLLFLFSVLLIRDDAADHGWLLGFLCLLIGITRPEGNLDVAAGITLRIFFMNSRERKNMLKPLFFAYVIPGACYFLWRFQYYGLFFPLPFYIKFGRGFASGIPTVMEFITSFVAWLAIPIIAGITFGIRDKKTAPLIIICLTHILFYCFPDHLMGFNFRFLFPVVPLLAMLSVYGIHQIQQNSLRVAGASLLSGLAFIQIFAFVFLKVFTESTGSTSFDVGLRYLRAAEQGVIKQGKLLAAFHYGPGLKLAISDAGALPFYCDWETIDLGGLNNPDIATSRPFDPNYVFRQKPDLIILASKSDKEWVWRKGFFKNEKGVYEGLKSNGYEFQYQVLSTGYYLWFFSKPGTDLTNYLKKASSNAL